VSAATSPSTFDEPVFLHVEVGDFDALMLQFPACVKHRLVLRLDRDDVLAPRGVEVRRAEDYAGAPASLHIAHADTQYRRIPLESFARLPTIGQPALRAQPALPSFHLTMSETRQHSISVDDAQLRVLDDGPVGGPPVLLAHSIMTAGSMWTPQVDFLASKGWRVLRAESRGHGASTLGTKHLSIDSLAADVVAILDRMRIQKVHFVGLSLGGMVGFALAQQHSERLETMALCDARADSPPAFAQPWDARIAQASADGMGSLVEPTLERWFGPRLQGVNDALLSTLRSSMRETSVGGFVATARALQAFDYTASLPAMQVPATLVVGEHDGVLPGVMADLAARMPNARLEVIPAAGHLPNVEQPEHFNTVLARHLGLA
jgi:3-oxoadipate enol-lactonase